MTQNGSRPSTVWITGGYLIGPASATASAASRYAIEPRSILGADRVRRLDWLSQYGLVAAEAAYRDAQLPLPVATERHEREGVTFGSAYGATATSVRYAKRLVNAGPAGTNPIDFPDSIDGAPAAHVALAFGLCGPSVTFVDGEESAISALVSAARFIAQERVDRMVVVVGDYLDDVFCQALESEPSYSNGRRQQAVFAMILERPGARSVASNVVELYGFSSRNPLPEGVPCVTTNQVHGDENDSVTDPSSALILARRWRQARDVKNVAHTIASPSYRGLALVGRC
jgi:hypothetical protein